MSEHPKSISDILFIDIETVAQSASYQELDSTWKDLWDIKANYLNRNHPEETCESAYQRAGIYAEFGKIICISCGIIHVNETGHRRLVLKSFAGHDEKTLLLAFKEMLARGWSGNANKFLCAHNGKEFDFPYICRRMVTHGIALPEMLQIAGKKPWDIRHLDTMELWKFGDFKSYTSLKLLAGVLGIDSPKDDIDGSMVNAVYWNDKNLERIVSYCQKDVITLVQVYLRLVCQPIIPVDHIDIRPPEF